MIAESLADRPGDELVPLDPPGELRTDVIGQRLIDQLVALPAEARRERAR